MRTLTALLSIVGVSFLACSESGIEGDQTEANLSARSLLAAAPKLGFNKTVESPLRGEALHIWKLDLRVGDRVRVTESLRKGNVGLDFALYDAVTSRKVDSTSHQVRPKSLAKSYVAPSAGQYYVAVVARDGRGAGDYRLALKCEGGPCAGEIPPPEPLELADADECQRRIRACTISAGRAIQGGVTQTKARSLMDGCRGSTSLPDGRSCGKACDGEDFGRACTGIVDVAAYLSKKSSACAAEFDSCMEECADPRGSDSSESVCLVDGFNSTCPSYVKQITECGGSLDKTTTEGCMEHCKVVRGAWVDDLDILCEEDCGLR